MPACKMDFAMLEYKPFYVNAIKLVLLDDGKDSPNFFRYGHIVFHIPRCAATPFLSSGYGVYQKIFVTKKIPFIFLRIVDFTCQMIFVHIRSRP